MDCSSFFLFFVFFYQTFLVLSIGLVRHYQCKDSMFHVVAPCTASRGNRLLTAAPLVFTPLPRVLSGCGNTAARWSVSGSLTRTELLKTLPPAGLGKEEAVCALLVASSEPPLPPC